ncbi:MAG: thioesterase family protein [Bacteroidia bacterium]
MKEIETYRGTIYPWHCDFNDHMNVRHYMANFDDATWQFFAAIGITPSYLKKENKGMVAVEQNIKYFEELFAGNLIYIKTSLIECKSKAVIIFHKMINVETNNIVAEAKMVGVHLDKESRKAVPFPDEIQNKLNKLVQKSDETKQESSIGKIES